MTKDLTTTSRRDESRMKRAGLRMALKLIPPDLIAQAPAALERHLADQLATVEPEQSEAGVCYLIAPDSDTNALRIMTVALDEDNRVTRIVKTTNLNELFNQILKGLSEL